MSSASLSLVNTLRFGLSYRLLSIFFIVAAALMRFWFLASNCPWDLSPDEAHYWDWSRNLDWSYYSKGPLVAYLIRGSCLLFGSWSVQLTGNEMIAVRLPAIVCGSLLLLSLHTLTMLVYGKPKLAFAVVVIALTMPLIAAGSIIMTIDSPYICCWGWSLVLAWLAIFRKAAWAWPVLGLVIGMGILAKYTMVLWFPSLGLFLLTSTTHRSLLWRPGFWISAGLAAVCCLPILIWNAQHDWMSFRHVSHLANGQKEETPFLWYGPLLYLGLQFLILIGFWFVVWARAMWHHRPWNSTNEQMNYLWWMSFVTFAVFLLFSFTTGGGEPNWPIAAYVSGLVLGAGWTLEEWKNANGFYRRMMEFSVVIGALFGLALTLIAHQSHQILPIIAKMVAPPSKSNRLPARRLDPTVRLRGWRSMACAVDAEVDKLRERGIEPVIAGERWNIPGELAFYCEGNPQVYSLGLAAGDRWSQYELWRPNPLFDPKQFRGKTFVIVGDAGLLRKHKLFQKFEPTRLYFHVVNGVPVASWRITICHGYQGGNFSPIGHNKY